MVALPAALPARALELAQREARSLSKHRPPTPPGELLQEEYLKPRGITQAEPASRSGVPIKQGQGKHQAA